MKTTTPLLLALPAILALVSLSVGQTPKAANNNIGVSGASAAADGGTASDFPPKKFDPRRYDAIFRKNPFMQEVVPVAEEKAEDPWADDLIVRAVTRIGGIYVVHVENTKLVGDEDPAQRRLAHHRLVEGQTSGDLRIQSVKPHRDASQVEVVLATGSGASVKTATVKYSDKQLKAKASTANKRPTTGRPTTRRTVPTTRKTTPTTTKGSTTPGKRRVILPPGLRGK